MYRMDDNRFLFPAVLDENLVAFSSLFLDYALLAMEASMVQATMDCWLCN